MNSKPAVLICTRFKYIGFPKTFTVMPDDFSEKEEASLKKYINEAMESVPELCSTHLQSRIMLVNKRHVILGVVAYLRDLSEDGWEGKDKGTRLIYGFFGYVWKRNGFVPFNDFPESSCFTKLLNTWIRPHWEDSPNGNWAEMPHISSYDADVTIQQSTEASSAYQPADYVGKTVVVSSDKEEQLVRWGMTQLTRSDDFSICTNVYVVSRQNYDGPFRYVSNMAKSTSANKSEVGQKRAKTAPDVTQESDSQKETV